MNKVMLVGRLTKDPEMRTSGETSISRFSVAVNRSFKNKNGEYDADFPNCVAFGKDAEFMEKYLKKGSMIGLVGRLQTGSYVNKDGKTVYTTDVVAEHVESVGNKGNNGDSATSDKSSEPKKSIKKPQVQEYEETDVGEEEDVDDTYPF